MAKMTQTELEAFVAEPHVAMMVTLNEDGSPHVAPIWYEHRDGRYMVWTSHDTRRARNIARDPRAALGMASATRPYRYVTVEGAASVRGHDVLPDAESIASRYDGPVEGPRFARSLTREGESVIITITPARVMSSAGD